MTNPFRRPAGRPIIYGHRGARGVLPENTMEGFAYLRQIGADAVELDVQNTADGVPVVIHDPLIPAQLARDPQGGWLDAPGPLVHALTAEDLRRYDIGRLNPNHRYAKRFPLQRPIDGARVPLLTEFLEWAGPDPSMTVNIEIKSHAHSTELGDSPQVLVETMLAALERHPLRAPCVISSFDWRVLSTLRAIAPDMPRAYLSCEDPGSENNIFKGSPYMDGLSLADHGGSLPRLIAAQGAHCWNTYHKDVTAQRVTEAHDLGLAVNVWTVNDTAEMQAMIDMGVDGVITDYPQTTMDLLAEASAAQG